MIPILLQTFTVLLNVNYDDLHSFEVFRLVEWVLYDIRLLAPVAIVWRYWLLLTRELLGRSERETALNMALVCIVFVHKSLYLRTAERRDR